MKRIMLFVIVSFIIKGSADAQDKKAGRQKSTAAFFTGVYPNTFSKKGYSQADVDAKVEKAYHDLFEGPDKVYFEAGDCYHNRVHHPGAGRRTLLLEHLL